MRIDVHAHFIPESCVDLDRRGGAGPAANRRDSLSDLDVRLRDMTERGVDMQLVSTPPWVANCDPATARRVNDATADAIAGRRDRLTGLATVPLNEPEAAAAELERCVKELGFRGAEILTNVRGENLNSARFGPFYRKMQELDAAVFVHPGNTLGGDRLSDFFLGNLIGNPTDTAVAAASLIFGGVLAEMPRLKFVLAHGGGSCPLLRGRTLGARVASRPRGAGGNPTTAERILPAALLRHPHPQCAGAELPGRNSRRQNASCWAATTRSAWATSQPPRTVEALPHASDADREAIYSGNAVRRGVFGLS